MIYIKEKAGKT